MDAASFKYLAIGLMAFALIGAAIGVALIFSSAANATSRNPNADNQIRTYALIGGAMAEAMGLLAFVVMMILIYT